jgi:hypothetical protein
MEMEKWNAQHAEGAGDECQERLIKKEGGNHAQDAKEKEQLLVQSVTEAVGKQKNKESASRDSLSV